jgi:aminopeptidase N
VNVKGEPHAATAWLPVNDHPSDKAELHLEATVPSAWTVVSNGLPGKTTEAGGEKTYRWADDKPMATYLMTMAVDKFTMSTSALKDGKPAIYAYGTGNDAQPDEEKKTAELVEYLAARFGNYPFSSAGGIVVSPVDDGEVGGVALETQTRPTYTAGMADVSTIHEMAHQWFGDNVSFSDWRDGCLAECFAQYTNWLLNERDGGDLDDQYRDEVANVKDDADFWKVTVYAPVGNPLHPTIYNRGSMMVHALRRTAGSDDKFYGMLKKWNTVHAYGNASFPDFEKFAADELHLDLTGFFKAWAHSSVIPPAEYLYPGSLKPAGR